MNLKGRPRPIEWFISPSIRLPRIWQLVQGIAALPNDRQLSRILPGTTGDEEPNGFDSRDRLIPRLFCYVVVD
jgi:hypothetical protein